MELVSKHPLELQPGDRVDLEKDPYADPAGDNPALEYEYQVVDGVEQETADCVRVDFEDSDSVGFPPEHILKVALGLDPPELTV